MFQAYVERLFNNKILAVQTDWRGEYHKLSSFFARIGISHLIFYPHTHQQNGATERKHRHIVGAGLSLLAHASMPLKFWDEAFATATFLINRTPSCVIDFDTPLHKLFHTTPDYSQLKVFGYAYWPNLRPYNARKLAFRSTKCVFLGYNPNLKGYKCLEGTSGRVYVSRDVVFDETVFPFAEMHPNAGARLRAEISLLDPTLISTNLGCNIDMTGANPTNPARIRS
jgi:hypothetical protein